MKKILINILMMLVVAPSLNLSNNKPQENPFLSVDDAEKVMDCMDEKEFTPNVFDIAKLTQNNIPKKPVASQTFTLDEYPFDKYAETEHFRIYYNSDDTQYSTAFDVGTLYEEIRGSYSSAGFKELYTKPGLSQLEIGLVGNSSGTTSAGYTQPYCFVDRNYGPTHIVLFGASNGITNAFKATAAHEYMHAIEIAYNCNMHLWLEEALADWGKNVICGYQDNFAWKAKKFIEINSYLFEEDDGTEINRGKMYGAALFPLTITKKCNGSVAPIVKMLEGLSDAGSEYSEQTFVNIVDTALAQSGSSLRYNQILNYMHSYMVNPAQWYSDFGANNPNEDWGHLAPAQYATINRTKLEGKVNGTISKASGRYIKFQIPSGLAGDVKYQISFSNNSCLSSKYVTKTDDGADHVLSTKVGSTTGYFTTYGKEYSDVGLVLTNPNVSQSASYTITYSFVPKEIKNAKTSYITFRPNDFHYYNGHGHIWYQLDLTFPVTNIQPIDYESIEVLNPEFNIFVGSFYSYDVYFDSYDSAFHATFYSNNQINAGKIRIAYTYEETLPTRTITCDGSINIPSFTSTDLDYFNGHGHIWYELNLSLQINIEQSKWDSVVIYGYVNDGSVDFYYDDIYFDRDTGIISIRLLTDDGNAHGAYGDLFILYTYKVLALA